MEPPILELKNVSVSYGHHKILDDISFSLEKGDTLAIIGPNGSGKTTLLKAILNIIPYQGEILKNQDIKIGYTPQKLDIERDLPLTINEFLNLYSVRNSIPLDKSRTFLRGIKPRRKDFNNTHSSPHQQTAEYSGKVRDKNQGNKISNVVYQTQDQTAYSPKSALELVNLAPSYLNKGLSELSAGEFQRTLIAGAIINYPDLLLFDEPTASVDIAGQETVYEMLYRLQKSHNLTLILISHELSVIYRYANKVLCLNHKAVCFGAPKEILTPEELEKVYGGGKHFYEHLTPQ